ncbi:MAG TPA: hypothetical protein VF219_19200 [Vicinamibacterales bacterium]
MDISEFTFESIEPLVGTTFRMTTTNGQAFDLKLTDVVKMLDKHIDTRMKRDSFAMHFLGPQEPYIPQATYAMTHESLGGPHPIFIVPISRGKDGYTYEAVFN